jgi:DNA-binding LacI/PurR family transcriptional regulator
VRPETPDTVHRDPAGSGAREDPGVRAARGDLAVPAARPKLATVAALAGVSSSTASLALRGSDRVSSPTRERVEAAAAQLGYAGADPVARSLRSRRSGIVGAVVSERLLYAFRDPVALQVLDGVAEVLGPLGAGLLLLAGDGEGGGPSAQRLRQVPLDAAVFVAGAVEDEPALDVLRQRGVPVGVAEGPDADDLALVAISDRAGSADLARHLHALGHERVAVVALPLRLDGTSGPLTDARAAGPGFRQPRNRIAGVTDVLGDVPVVEAALGSVEEGERVGGLLLDVPVAARPTVVVAQSDLLAAGVLRAAERHGLRVPDDLSVAGFDGVDLPGLTPGHLTTVVQPAVEKGRALAAAVVAMLDGAAPPRVVLPVRLHVGGTTGPAPR